MKKFLKILLFTLLGLIVVILVGLQILLHSKVTTNFVNKLASENIDGNIRFSNLHFNVIKSFPNLNVTVDSLVLTYPHDRYARYDVAGKHDYRLDAGRGELEDTLATLKNFKANFNYWQLLEDHICLNKTELDNFVVYAHAYDDTTANWQLFRTATQRDTAKAASELPWITIGRLEVKESPRVVFTNQKSEIFADLSFKEFALGGKYKFSPEIVKIRKAALDIDSLQVDAKLGKDDYKFALDYFNVDESIFHVFDIKMGADAMAFTSKLGRLDIPVRIDGRVGFNHTAEYNKFVIPNMDARVAHIPLDVKGNTTLYKDSTILSAKVNVHDCSVDTLLTEYLVHFTDFANKVSTTARMDLSVEADGTLSKTMFPAVKAAVKIPGGMVYYKSSDKKASVRLDAEAELTKKNKVNASVNELYAATDGITINALATVKDLLGYDPAYKLDANGYVLLDSLVYVLPASAGISSASGRMDLNVQAEANQSAFEDFKFNKAKINGLISGNVLTLKMPKDTIDAEMYNPDITFNTGSDGLDLKACFDSVHFNMGRRLTARLREMENHATMSRVERRGQSTPYLTFSSDNKRAFVKIGSDRLRAQKVSASFTALRRVRPNRDSLRQRGGRPDSLRQRQVRADRAISDFVSRDISFKADSSAANLLRDWSPTGKISFGRVAYTSPLMPLRTRMQNVDASFDDNNVRIDSLRIQSGTSDVFAKVHVKGLRRMLLRGRGMLDADITVKSRRINVNEIVESCFRGKKDDRVVSIDNEYDESFVVDSIHNAKIDSLPIILVVVPGNIKATARVDANEVDFAEIVAKPVSVVAKMQDRKFQMTDGLVSSNLGDARMNAFYSTQSMKDISMGVDVRISKVSAAKIIHLMPSVDDMMPALKTFDGDFDVDLSATTRLDENMNFIMPTLDGYLKITGKDLEIADVGEKIAGWTKLLGLRSPYDIKISDFVASAVAHDNRLEVFPFELSVEKYKVALYGAMGFDKKLNTHVSVLKSPLIIRPGFNLIGNIPDVKFSLGKPKYADGTVPAFTEDLDNVQVNMAKSILNIFNIGMNDVRRYNAQNLEKLYESTRAAGFDPSMGAGEMTIAERAQFDNVILDSMLEETEVQTDDAGVDKILEETLKEIKQ